LLVFCDPEDRSFADSIVVPGPDWRKLRARRSGVPGPGVV